MANQNQRYRNDLNRDQEPNRDPNRDYDGYHVQNRNEENDDHVVYAANYPGPQDQNINREGMPFNTFGSSYGSYNRELAYRTPMAGYRQRQNEISSSTRGTHQGRGPKSWKRSDERIHDEVCDILARDPHVDATEIEVLVKEGIVTLNGHVEDRPSKRHAEDLIEHLMGVHDVRNHLTIDQSLFQQAKEFFTGEHASQIDEKKIEEKPSRKH